MSTAVESTGQRAPISRRWVAGYGLMYFGQHLSWAAPVQILLAVQVLELYPQDKERMLALLMAAGGLAAVIAGPVAGHLADATRTRLGRRLPWMISGSLVAAGMLAVAGMTQDYAMLLIVWVVFQVALAASQTSAQSIPPDRVPQHQYGMVSGVMGLTYTAAVVVGSALGAVLPTRAAYLAVGAVMLLCLAPFAFTYREPEAPRVERRAGFALPRFAEAPDFWWVFLARLLVTLAQSIALFYLLYFLRDQVHHPDPETGVLILSAIYAVFVIISALWSGRASDRSGKRRRFVSLSSFGVAIASLVMAVATDFTVVMAAAALLGVSWGVFQAIDQALINHVLPSADDRAAHIGIVNLAVHIPNTAAPALAALLVMYAGGYSGLYSVAAALTMVGGLVVWKVRSVP